MISHAVAQAMRQADYDQHPYAWVITRDRDTEMSRAMYDDDQESEVDTAGPAAATDDMIDLARKYGRPFRLCDEGDIDDIAESHGITVAPTERGVVYEGRIWTADEPGTETDFAPLEDFGTPNYGCTAIQYYGKDGWETL